MHDSRVYDPTMHDSRINYHEQYHEHADGADRAYTASKS